MVQSIVASRVTGPFQQLLADGTTRQIPDGAAVLTGTVAKDSLFWLTRDYDAAPSTWYPSGGFILTTALANDSSKPKVWSFPARTAQNTAGIIPPVDRSNWQEVLFGFSTSLCTGNQVNTPSFSIPAQIMGVPKRIHDFTTSGAPHDFVYYTAPVKLPAATVQAGTFWLSHGPQTFAQGQLWIYDGWSFIGGQSAPPPPVAPASYTLQFRLQGARLNHRLTLTAPDTITFTDLYSYSSAGQSSIVFGDPWHPPTTWTATMLNKTFSLNYQGPSGATDLWTLADEDTGQQIQVAPMTVANTSLDLIGWELPADPVNLQISASRLDHSLWLQQRDGSAYHVVKNGTVGDVSMSYNGTVWLNPYYYMEASSSRKEGIDYWIYDEDTGEESPHMQYGYSSSTLINWIALPTPTAPHATGGTDFHVRLQWALGAASDGGTFSVERKTPAMTSWAEILSIPAANASSDKLFDQIDGSGQSSTACQYRIRYSYGGRFSAYSPICAYQGTADVDSDGDGIGDAWETAHGRDSADASDAGADWDGDGIPDLWEVLHGLNPTRKGDGEEDWDGDGLPNWAEYVLGTNPLTPFTGGSGVLDGNQDSDSDGVNDRVEVLSWKNPWTPTAAETAAFEAEASPFQQLIDSWRSEGGSGAGGVAAAAPRVTTPRSPVWQSVSANPQIDPVTGTSPTYNQVLIRWENDSDDASGTEVWRGELQHTKAGSTTEWKMIEPKGPVSRGTVQSCLDTDIEARRLYCYRVRPWNSAGYAFEEPSKLLHMQYHAPLLRGIWTRAAAKTTSIPGWKQFTPPSNIFQPVKHYLKRTISKSNDVYTLASQEEHWPWPYSTGIKIDSQSGTKNYSVVQTSHPYPAVYPSVITGSPDQYFSTTGTYFNSFNDFTEDKNPYSKFNRTNTQISGETTPIVPEFSTFNDTSGFSWVGSETKVNDCVPASDTPLETAAWTPRLFETLYNEDTEIPEPETAASRTFSYDNHYGRVTESYDRAELLSQEYLPMDFVDGVASRVVLPAAFSLHTLVTAGVPDSSSNLSFDGARENLNFLKSSYYFETYPGDFSKMSLIHVRNISRRNNLEILNPNKPGRFDSGHLSARSGFAATLAVLEEPTASNRSPEHTEDPRDITDTVDYVDGTLGGTSINPYILTSCMG